jgi:hypothetical protein
MILIIIQADCFSRVWRSTRKWKTEVEIRPQLKITPVIGIKVPLWSLLTMKDASVAIPHWRVP